MLYALRLIGLGGLLLSLGTGCAKPAAEPDKVPPTKPPASSTLAAQSSDPKCCCELDSAATSDSPTHPLVTPWIDPDKRAASRNLNVSVTDQDGITFPLGRLRGKPTALAFVYTRCTNERKCPLVARTTGKLVSQLEQAGLLDRVSINVISYDPQYDTPERLKAYAAAHDVPVGPSASFLRPDLAQKEMFFKELQVAVNFDARQEVNLHGIQLVLLDSQLRFVRRYQSLIWNNDEVLADLRQLLDEE